MSQIGAGNSCLITQPLPSGLEDNKSDPFLSVINHLQCGHLKGFWPLTKPGIDSDLKKKSDLKTWLIGCRMWSHSLSDGHKC